MVTNTDARTASPAAAGFWKRPLGESGIPIWTFVLNVPAWPVMTAGVVLVVRAQPGPGAALIAAGVAMQIPFYRFLFRKLHTRAVPSA